MGKNGWFSAWTYIKNAKIIYSKYNSSLRLFVCVTCNTWFMQRRVKESLPVSKIAINGNGAKVEQIRQNCQKRNHQMYDLLKQKKTSS